MDRTREGTPVAQGAVFGAGGHVKAATVEGCACNAVLMPFQRAKAGCSAHVPEAGYVVGSHCQQQLTIRGQNEPLEAVDRYPSA